ncbi:uncharacterized protein [Globicephala melas]|uniref:uncharacterized protein isoform X3 n=1 Tax=Globicephala melas TaxID=9731 RepID=UPI00293D9BDA|nr:uncharacterized protein LOC132598370 isoform X3 [Globicephala melas]
MTLVILENHHSGRSTSVNPQREEWLAGQLGNKEHKPSFVISEHLDEAKVASCFPKTLHGALKTSDRKHVHPRPAETRKLAMLKASTLMPAHPRTEHELIMSPAAPSPSLPLPLKPLSPDR